MGKVELRTHEAGAVLLCLAMASVPLALFLASPALYLTGSAVFLVVYTAHAWIHRKMGKSYMLTAAGYALAGWWVLLWPFLYNLAFKDLPQFARSGRTAPEGYRLIY